MGSTTHISWTDATWNIARGCTKVDADCKYCYMYRESMGGTRHDPFEVTRTKGAFTMPLRYKEKKSSCWDGNPLIFTSSLTDFFHEDIDSYRDEAWDIIRKCPHLTFQILTKRPERIKEHLPADWGDGWDNVWLGTSCGSQDSLHRMYALVEVPAKVRFLSIEPMHGEVILPWGFMGPVEVTPGKVFYWNDIIHWVIVGGESGFETGKYRYRPAEISWFNGIVAKCRSEQIPVFVKQLGTHLQKTRGMKSKHGTDIDEFPKNLQVRQFPKQNTIS